MNDANTTDEERTDEQEAPPTQTGPAEDPEDSASQGSVASQGEAPQGDAGGSVAGTADDEPVTETGGSADAGSRLVTVVEYATFGILSLLALLATFRFYFAASEAIRLWFSSDFVPLFQAAFNLVVLIAAAIGVSVLIRRINRK